MRRGEIEFHVHYFIWLALLDFYKEHRTRESRSRCSLLQLKFNSIIFIFWKG